MNDGSLSSGLIRVIFRSISFRLFITDWNELKLIAPCSLRVSSLVTSRSVHLPLTVSHAINLHSGCFTAPIHSFSFVALTSLHFVSHLTNYVHYPFNFTSIRYINFPSLHSVQLLYLHTAHWSEDKTITEYYNTQFKLNYHWLFLCSYFIA